MNNFNVPYFLNIPWLNEDYVRRNAWYPVSELILEGEKRVETRFGLVPCKSRSEFRVGDVVIHDCFSEWPDADGRIVNDRFHVVSCDEVEAYLSNNSDWRMRTNLLPIGVAVRSPAFLALGKMGIKEI